MSIPPPILQVKRKRMGEEPPDILQIETKKIRRTTIDFESDEWVFQRVRHDSAKEVPLKQSIHEPKPWENKVPLIKATKPGDELRGDSSPREDILRTQKPSVLNTNRPVQAPLVAEGNTVSQPPRRFHLARASRSMSQSPVNGVRKRRREKSVATFKERVPPHAIEAILGDKEPDAINTHEHPGNSVQLEAKEYVKGEMTTSYNSDAKEQVKTPTTTSISTTTQKKPGRNARKGLKQAPSMLAGNAKYDVGSDELAAEMQKFSLATMAHDLTKEDSNSKVTSNNMFAHRPDVKFKPKAPAQRYHERNPEVIESKSPEVDDDTDDESEYITDTYVRIPAHTLQIVPTDMGVLVIENDEEMQKFYEYGDDSSDDSDIFDEEIDENAEGNPNNEYPDEEVDSDDEFDLNSYKYRYNASDDEEYDLDETTFSEDELPSSKWNVNPWVKKPKSSSTLWDDEDDEISES